MRRTGLYASVATFTVLATTVLAGATSHARAASVRAAAPDPTCQNLVQSHNRFSYPPDAHWVWTIPSGCVFIQDRGATDSCPALDCAPPPDVHVRYLRRTYVFHLTQQGLPATTKGLYRA